MAKTRLASIKEFVEQMRGGIAAEIEAKEHEYSDQLFRLKFQLASGQTDTLKKIRELRKDIARIKTIRREREARTRTAEAS